MDKEYIRTPVTSTIDISTLVTIFRLAYDPDNLRDSGERHDFYELVYVESGEFRVDIDGRPCRVQPGELVIYTPGAHHVKSKDATAALIYIVSFATAAPIKVDIFNRPLKLSFRQYALLSALFSDALQIQKIHVKDKIRKGMILINSENHLALQKVKDELELLLIELCEASDIDTVQIAASNTHNASAADLARVTVFLRAHLCEALTVEEIAEGCLMSVSKLKKLFSRHHAGGIIGYFNTLKINEAKQLITNSSMNLTQISEALGFTYPHYFSRIFRAKVGMTPSQYARQIDKR